MPEMELQFLIAEDEPYVDIGGEQARTLGEVAALIDPGSDPESFALATLHLRGEGDFQPIDEELAASDRWESDAFGSWNLEGVHPARREADGSFRFFAQHVFTRVPYQVTAVPGSGGAWDVRFELLPPLSEPPLFQESP